jgi:hypothetical protein
MSTGIKYWIKRLIGTEKAKVFTILKSEKVSKYTTEKLNYLNAKRICLYSRVCTPSLNKDDEIAES